MVPSFSGGMNSDPRLRNTGTVRAMTRMATVMVAQRWFSVASSAG